MDDSDWVEITAEQDLSPFLGTQVELGESRHRLLDALSALPGSADWLMEDTPPPIRWDDPEVYVWDDPGVYVQIRRSRLYFNVSKAKKVRADWVVLLIAYLASGNLGLASILSAANKLRENLAILTEDEVEVLGVIRGLAHGNPYATPVSEQAVREAYRDATISIDQLLDSLERRGVIRTERGGMLRMVF